MKIVRFDYNKYRFDIIQIPIMFTLWFVLMFIGVILCEMVLGLSLYNYVNTNPYWDYHSDQGLYILIGLILITALLGYLLSFILSRKVVAGEGKVEIYGSYALLYVKGHEYRIEKSTTQLQPKSMNIRGDITNYVLHQNNKKIIIRESYKDAKKGPINSRAKISSLTKAMNAIAPFVERYKDKKSNICNELVVIGDVSVELGESTTDIFDCSAYYVDYDNAVMPEDVPLVSCMVRERANPSHVVGDLSFYFDDGVNFKDLSEQLLRDRPIDSALALDEDIKDYEA